MSLGAYVLEPLSEVESRTQGSRPSPRTQKKIRGQGQGQPFRVQTLSRPRTGMLEAKDQGHKRKCSPKKKKRSSQKFFRRSQKKRSSQKFFWRSPPKKRSSQKFFRRSPKKKGLYKNFSSAPQNFNNSKNSAVLEPRTGQFSRTWGLEAKDLTFEAKAKDFKICPRGQGRPRGLHLWPLYSCALLSVPLCRVSTKVGIHSFRAWRLAIKRNNVKPWSCVVDKWARGSLTWRPKGLFAVSWPKKLGG